MLQVYSIRDIHFNEYEWGKLTYDTVKRQGTIDFNKDGVNHYYEMPLMIQMWVRNGVFHLNEEQTRNHIGGMVQPPERPNSAYIMQLLGESDFNPIAIYLHLKGRTTTDMTHLVRIK